MSHSHNHSHKTSWGTKNLLIWIILNSIIVIAEIIGWILSWSLALISDAIHNFSDVISLILSFIWEKISNKKANFKYTFAFKRVEVITAFVNSLTLIIIGLYIIYESIQRIIYNDFQVNSSLMFWVAMVWFLWNFISILFLHREKDENLNKKSAYFHLLFDTISSVIVIIWAIIIYYTGFYYIDIIASLVISIFVIHSGFDIFKKSLHILMQWTPENINLEDVYNLIKSYEWVIELHDLYIWSIDTNHNFLSAHILFDESYDKNEFIHNINHKLEDDYNIFSSSLQVVEKKCC